MQQPEVADPARRAEALFPQCLSQPADRLSIAILLAIPILGFGLPAAFGQPLIPGDDLFQNLPLRILAGRLLQAGHLPLWDRWIWSGSPLLGGLNAGALYPGTFLFALSSPAVAWTLNEIAVYAVCATGAYALFRHHALEPAAAFVGAATGTFAGLLAVHLGNFGLVQGLSWAPWILLALDHCATSDRRHRPVWFAVLAGAGGLVLLSGEPRAISNVAISVGIYAVALIWRTRDRKQLLLTALVGAALAFAIGAGQLLPGLAFVAESQRGKVPYAFFALGSLDPHYWALQLVPSLLGKYRTQPYDLRAVSLGYVGLLPLVALVTFPLWRRRARGMPAAWLAMVGVGVLLAMGSNTPLGPLLYRIPFYGGQRMQYRNMGIADLGLAGLLACWMDALLRASKPRAAVERLLSLAPALGTLGVIVASPWWGPNLQDFFDGEVRQPSLAEVFPYRAMTLVLAAAVAVVASRAEVWPLRFRRWAVIAVVLFDLGLGLSQQDLSTAPIRTLLKAPPEISKIQPLLSGNGRFALYDPKQRARPSPLTTALSPDLSGLLGLLSVQGFGSVLDSNYWLATDSHLIRSLDPAVLAGTLADELDLRLVFVPVSYLTQKRGDPRPVDLALMKALDPAHWQESDRYGDLRSFLNLRTRPHAWVATPTEPATGEEAATAPEVTTVQIGDQDAETDRVSSPVPALLVRSVAYAEGWTAHLQTPAGPEIAPAVRRGVLQSVAIPAGPVTVEWRYEPPGASLGFGLSLSGSGALACLLLACLGFRLRARSRDVRSN